MSFSHYCSVTGCACGWLLCFSFCSLDINNNEQLVIVTRRASNYILGVEGHSTSADISTQDKERNLFIQKCVKDSTIASLPLCCTNMSLFIWNDLLIFFNGVMGCLFCFCFWLFKLVLYTWHQSVMKLPSRVVHISFINQTFLHLH